MPHSLDRREFLRAGALSTAGLALAGVPAIAARRGDVNCIFLFLVGGPSQLDTWDPKPNAPAEVRGPFRPIRTTVPGTHLSECFPRMAAAADRFALVRTVHHDEAPIHETGHQLMQTGHLFRTGPERPHYGAVVSKEFGPRRAGVPANALVPGPIESTGVSVSHGQGAGPLGPAHELHAPPLTFLAARDVERYGGTPFGNSCLRARQLVEYGTRFVTVNMFTTVFDCLSWDCHADGGSLRTTLDDYRSVLCPTFDLAFTALLDDLQARGLLESTLVVATGEFGRTPYLNPRGGRDHYPGCWTMLLAGGGVQGGRVVGTSDKHAAEPKDRPVTPQEVAATVYHALGIDPRTQGISAPPIAELF
jgi:uncharacterized protein (DUF1501 family)